MTYRMAIIGAALAVSAACGGGGAPAEQAPAPPAAPAPAPQQQPQTAEQAAQQAAKGLEQMAKGLESMAAGGAGGEFKPVDPVSFRDLQALFPDIDGWEKGKPTGERMSSPFSFSQAEVTYRKGDARVELKMVDSGFNQLLLTPYAMFLQAGYEKETQDGYEKSTTVNGQPGWETWNTEGKDGDLNALVGKRFLVSLEGRNVDDIKVLHEFAGRIDMARLAALK
jgi:hypothetical protein